MPKGVVWSEWAAQSKYKGRGSGRGAWPGLASWLEETSSSRTTLGHNCLHLTVLGALETVDQAED